MGSLRGKRIGIARNVTQISKNEFSHMMDAFEKAIVIMRSAGAIIIEDTDFTAYAEVTTRGFNPVPRSEFLHDLPNYLKNLEWNPNGITDLNSLSFMFSFRCNSHRTRVQLYARASDVIIDTKCTCHPSNLVVAVPHMPYRAAPPLN